MSWLKQTAAALSTAAEMAGNSIAFIKRKTGITVTDDQADILVAKTERAADQLEAILVDLIDEIPGVPRIVAKIAVACAMKIIDAAIAAAGEGVKAHN